MHADFRASHLNLSIYWLWESTLYVQAVLSVYALQCLTGKVDNMRIVITARARDNMRIINFGKLIIITIQILSL